MIHYFHGITPLIQNTHNAYLEVYFAFHFIMITLQKNKVWVNKQKNYLVNEGVHPDGTAYYPPTL